MNAAAQGRLIKLVRNITLGALIFLLLEMAVGAVVLKTVQRRLGLKITGVFWPLPFRTSFYSTNAKIFWKNRVTLLSGNLKIDYNPIPLLYKNVIRVKISGSDIKAELAGDWAKMQGVEAIQIDSLLADVDVAAKGLGEIYWVDAQSPTFEFHIHKTGS